MRKVHLVLLAAAVVANAAIAQAPAPLAGKAPVAAPPAAGTVKAVQPGLFEVAGPRVNEAVAAGVQKITATTGKGWRSITVQSPWGYSYFGWPKNLKPVAFTIEAGKPAGGATITAPGFNDANKADYKAAIEGVVQHAITSTLQNKAFAEGSR
jgi:hypothetical protein